MTTLNSSSSEKRVVKLDVVTSSEVKAIIYLSDLKGLSRAKDGNERSFIFIPNTTFQPSRQAVFYSTGLLKFKCSDYYKMLKKVDDLLMNTVKGMDQKLEELFGKGPSRQKNYRRGTPLGTIYIYAPDLISWFDGKNWHKLTLEE